MKKLLLTIISLVSFLVAKADLGGFYYTNWSVEATITGKNEWRIHEVEDVHFNEPRHGIYRYIPLDYYASLNIAQDGEKERTPPRQFYPKVNITSTSGDEVYIYDDGEDNRVIRFGSADYKVTGDKHYVIDFNYDYPDDRIDVRDFIFHTLKPADINEEVQRFSFDLRFEKPLPDDIAERLKIYIGKMGDRKECQVFDSLQVSPTHIYGVISNVYPGEAVTLYAELPQGFWEDTHKESPLLARIFCWISLLLGGILLFMEVTRRYNPVVKTVEFYAPNGITPSEVGVIIDNSSDIIDLTSLVPWLAQRGYLSIREIKGSLLKKNDIELTKLKDLPADAPRYQQLIMEMLFPTGDKVQLMSELGNHPKKVEAAKNALASNFKGERTLVTSKGGWLALLLMITSTLALGLSNPARVSGWEVLIYFAIWFLPFALAYVLRSMNSPKDIFRSRAWLIFCRLIRLFPLVINCFILLISLWEAEENLLSGVELLSMIILCFVVTEFCHRLVYDTPYRESVKGSLLGFKEFIETAEKDRLQMLVDQDPEYFYSVLPYAMVFEVTNKWVDQFKDIQVKEVDWYNSTSAGTPSYLSSLSTGMNHTVNNAINTQSHSASSSSGGGGFSGGGGGGGGGGSW